MKKALVVICVLLFALCLGLNYNHKIPASNESGQNSANTDWRHSEIKNSLGSCDSFFEDYEIYAEKGIRVKYSEIPEIDENGWKGHHYSRTGNVENIVFDEKYTDELLPSVRIGLEPSEIQNILGTPDFSDDELKVFGYKRSDFYIFFQGEKEITQASIYPRYSNYDSEIVKEAINHCNGKERSPELAAEVVQMLENHWSDYNYSYSVLGNAKYSDRRNSAGIAYFAKGLAVYYDHENASLFHIYDNFNGDLSDEAYAVTDATGKKLVTFYAGTDLVFEQEKTRIKAEKTLEDRIKKEGVVSPDGNRVLLDNSRSDGIDVICLNGDAPNYCIKTSPLQYGAAQWLSDRYIVYVYGKNEVRVYDLLDNQYQRIYSGSAEIKSVQDGCITITSASEAETVIQYVFNNLDEISFANIDGTPLDGVGNWIDGKLADENF